MFVWLWDADGEQRSELGVSGDRVSAMRAAADSLLAGDGKQARVEQAVPALDPVTLCGAYCRTGCGWTARRAGHGVEWQPFAA